MRALELLAWSVHFGKTHSGSAYCDLEDPHSPVCLGGVLPSSLGSYMLVEAAGHVPMSRPSLRRLATSWWQEAMLQRAIVGACRSVLLEYRISKD